MKLENGFGSVCKVKRNLRKPWLARITQEIITDKDGKKQQIRKTLGYYETKSQAMAALVEYNKSRLNIDYKDLTFSDCWKLWWNDLDKSSLSESTLKGYDFVYRGIPDRIKKTKIGDLKVRDYQQFFNNMDRSYNTKRKSKVVIGLMYNYLIKNEIIDLNVVSYVELKNNKKDNDVIIFTDQEIEKLWNIWNEEQNEWIGLILMLIYSGVRIGEMLELKREDVYLEDRYFKITKSKTENGIRQVPISERVIEIWNHWMNYGFEYVVSLNKLTGPGTYKRVKVDYSNFRDTYWDKIIEQLSFNDKLTPHACRKTCISLMTRADIKPIYIKLIVGHSGSMDLTERVYTYVDIKELIDCINKI